MDISRLRSMLYLVEAKPAEQKDGVYTNGCFHRQTEIEGKSYIQRVLFSCGKDVGYDKLFLALKKDFEDGFLDGYSDLRLFITLERAQKGNSFMNISAENGVDDSINKLKSLEDEIIKGNIAPGCIILGNNWGKRDDAISVSGIGFDTLVYLTAYDGTSDIRLTTKTETKHLTPFINGKIEDDFLVVYDNGKEMLRERLYQ